MGCASSRRAWEWQYSKFQPDQRVASVPPKTLTAIKWIHTDQQIYLTPNPDGGESGECVKTAIKSSENRAKGPREPARSRQKPTPARGPCEISPSPRSRTTWNAGPCKPAGVEVMTPEIIAPRK